MESGRAELTDEFLGKCLDLGFGLATEGANFQQQIDAMTEAGCPKLMAYWFANLVPILAGRQILAASGRMPQLADHYVLVDRQGNERVVRFAECPLCRAAARRLVRLDPAELAAIGLGSCEVQALNGMLARMGPQADEGAVESIAIEAPRMEG